MESSTPTLWSRITSRNSLLSHNSQVSGEHGNYTRTASTENTEYRGYWGRRWTGDGRPKRSRRWFGRGRRNAKGRALMRRRKNNCNCNNNNMHTLEMDSDIDKDDIRHAESQCRTENFARCTSSVSPWDSFLFEQSSLDNSSNCLSTYPARRLTSPY